MNYPIGARVVHPSQQHHWPQSPSSDGTTDAFQQLLRDAQAGCDTAARELLETYGPHVVRAVRRNLNRSIRSKFDSADFAQAVWASFFAQLQDHQEFAHPQALLGYLTTMARNKVVDESRRRLTSHKYDVKLEQPLPGEDDARMNGREPTASQVAVADELWDRLIAGQPPHYQAILRLRRDGLTNGEIAQQLSISEKTVRRLIRRLFEDQP
jgi:RNA polymerase sigma factor (sigma-70 family)